MGSMRLPEHVAGIVVAADRRAGDGAQLEHGLRAVGHEAGMHFDGDLHAVIGGEFGLLDPVGRHLGFPLPLQDLQVVRRPGAGDPVGPLGFVAIARAAGKIDDHGNAQFLGQADGFAADVLIVLGALLIGVQRIAVAAQRADGEAVIRQLLLEFVQFGLAVQHGQLAVWIARVIACPEFHRIDIDALEFL